MEKIKEILVCDDGITSYQVLEGLFNAVDTDVFDPYRTIVDYLKIEEIAFMVYQNDAFLDNTDIRRYHSMGNPVRYTGEMLTTVQDWSTCSACISCLLDYSIRHTGQFSSQTDLLKVQREDWMELFCSKHIDRVGARIKNWDLVYVSPRKGEFRLVIYTCRRKWRWI